VFVCVSVCVYVSVCACDATSVLVATSAVLACVFCSLYLLLPVFAASPCLSCGWEAKNSSGGRAVLRRGANTCPTVVSVLLQWCYSVVIAVLELCYIVGTLVSQWCYL
jgi:hypothetical protein